MPLELKSTDVTGIQANHVAEFTEKSKEIIAAEGLEPSFAFEDDTPSDTAYKLYNPDAEKPNTQIYVEGVDGKEVELSTESDNVRQLTKRYTLIRYYYPASVRERIKTEAEPLLGKD